MVQIWNMGFCLGLLAPVADSANQAQCLMNPKCAELELEGNCCPTSDDVMLDCCQGTEGETLAAFDIPPSMQPPQGAEGETSAAYAIPPSMQPPQVLAAPSMHPFYGLPAQFQPFLPPAEKYGYNGKSYATMAEVNKAIAVEEARVEGSANAERVESYMYNGKNYATMTELNEAISAETGLPTLSANTEESPSPMPLPPVDFTEPYTYNGKTYATLAEVNEAIAAATGMPSVDSAKIQLPNTFDVQYEVNEATAAATGKPSVDSAETQSPKNVEVQAGSDQLFN